MNKGTVDRGEALICVKLRKGPPPYGLEIWSSRDARVVHIFFRSILGTRTPLRNAPFKYSTRF